MDDEPAKLSLETLGWGPFWEEQFLPFREKGFEPARVAVEDKHQYLVLTAQGELPANAAGKILHQAKSPAELPKVGDWVALALLADEGKGVIHHILPRKTKLSRKVPGKATEEHVLVTNVDTVFIVHALDSTFNLNRLQRHLVPVFESGAKPVIVLNKSDLCADVAGLLEETRRIAPDVPILAVSAKTGDTIDQLARLVRPGETIALIGASGVGKSSLINCLAGEEIQATAEVRDKDSKGRHTTAWRELMVLPGGGLIIDTPGLRELHLWTADEGLHEAYADIEELALQCHFRSCTHTVEKGCAVLDALNGGQISRQRYENYLKLRKELAELEQARERRARLERKRQNRLAQRALSRARAKLEEDDDEDAEE